MARKTTKAANSLIERFNATRQGMDNILSQRTKSNPEFWSSFMRKHDEDYVGTFMYAQQQLVEQFLMDQNCYHGFYYVDGTGQRLDWRGKFESVDKHPDYRCWRVVFFRQ